LRAAPTGLRRTLLLQSAASLSVLRAGFALGASGDERPRQQDRYNKQLRQGIQFGHVACDDSALSCSETRSPGAEPSGKKRERRSVGRPQPYRDEFAFARWGCAIHGGNDARIEVER
jgi:hypothetical protein